MMMLLLTRIRLWYQEHKAMRRLGDLDDRTLRDLGITRDQIPNAVAGLQRFQD
jgi:uncharacterized protein YjiS (DUF1127 family)